MTSRGHSVVGIARNRAAVPEGVELVTGSIHDKELVRQTVAGADHIVIALHAHAQDGPKLADALPLLIDVAITEGARLSFVGGAGSLQVVEGGPQLFHTPVSSRPCATVVTPSTGSTSAPPRVSARGTRVSAPARSASAEMCCSLTMRATRRSVATTSPSRTSTRSTTAHTDVSASASRTRQQHAFERTP